MSSTYQSFTPPRRVLMGPGPSDVPERILQAMARPTIGHLDPAFIGLMDEIKELLRYAFRTENRLTMPVSGPGTVGMETCVVNLVEPGDTVLVGINGVFGGRLREMVLRAGGKVVEVRAPWGRALDVEDVRRTLDEHPDVKVVAFVHAETSTGARTDAEAIARVAREHGCLTLVDAVTSLGGSPVLTDAWGLDMVYSGSQKCLSCTPGLSPITVSERAVERIRHRIRPVQSWFMDLNLVMAYWEGEGMQRAYHHTAPINPLYGLHEALLMLYEEGLEQAWERHKRMHLGLTAGLEALGLSFFVPEEERLWQLNAIVVPEGVDEKKVRMQLLEEYQLEIGAGLGDMAGTIWRIGLMGYSARVENVYHCVEALGKTLQAQGWKASVQEALEAVEVELASFTS